MIITGIRQHDVLAAVIEVVTGKRFGLYVKENIFEPVGMKRSTFLLPENELRNMIKKDSTEFNRNAWEGNFMILY